MESAFNPLETLRRSAAPSRVVEEFRPVTESVEWRLSELYWMTQGTRGFMEEQIPYSVTSGGMLSQDAAAVLLANCQDDPPAGPVVVLELCAGSGLFARFFVDAFRRLCVGAGERFHEKLVYYATDRSPETVAQWKKLGVFEATGVVAACGDARRPLHLETEDGPVELGSLRAVICNYGLDSLPASILRRGEHGPEELCVRTHLTADDERIRQSGGVTVEDLRDRLQRPDAGLLPMSRLLEVEAAFRPCERAYPMMEEALSRFGDSPRVILNHGAIGCLREIVSALEPGGFVLVNDYGVVGREVPAEYGNSQRFGASAAIGLHFPMLAAAMEAVGAELIAPDSDSFSNLHSRLLLRTAAPATRAVFADRFGAVRMAARKKLREEAQSYTEAGAVESAKRVYEQALADCPRDWSLLGEVAEFLIRQAVDYESGAEVCKAALALNPWFSTWLWNVFGDANYGLKKYGEALAAYRIAEEMSPCDVRTQVNLSYAYAALNNYEAALVAIARGFAHDLTGEYRERLREKQQQILGSVRAMFAGDGQARERRTQRLNAC